MDITNISLVLTSFTALAAVIGPVITSVVTVRSNEQAKKFETHSPKVYAAVQRFTEAYSKLPRQTACSWTGDLERSSMISEYATAYKSLTAAGYEVMSLFPSGEIQEQISSLLTGLDGEFYVDAKRDQQFRKLTEAISVEISAEFSPMKKRRKRNKKRSSSE